MARLAGFFYAVIILCGIWSEVAVRAAVIVPGNDGATAANVLAAPGLLRLSFFADTIMAIADVALAVLLFALLRPAGPVLSLAAMVFRLVQAAAISGAILLQYGGLLWLEHGGSAEFAGLLFAMQAHGYDLGLIFFGVNCLLVAGLLVRSSFFPDWLGWLIVAAGLVYLLGSILRFTLPGVWQGFQAFYAAPLISELAFCGYLLIRGVDAAAWAAAAKVQR